HHILAQFRVVSAQHALGRRRVNATLAIMARVKQKLRAALDADVTQTEEQRAVRLAMTPDTKQLAAGIGAIDLRLEILNPATHAEPFRRRGASRRRDCQTERARQKEHSADETGRVFHLTSPDGSP